MKVTAASLIVLLFCLFVAAQEMPSKNAKVEYEDANVRVSRVNLASNETFESRRWLSSVQVPLTSNEVTVACKDHQPYSAKVLAGKPGWSEARDCSVANGAGALEAIVVELKNADAVAKPLTNPPTPHPANYLDEPLHHWAFENQYVRVYDVHLPPGVTTGYHVHAFDTIFVEISGGTEAAQMKGSEEWKSVRGVAGEVSFMGDSKKTRVHRVRNDGKDEYHVIAIQVLDSNSK